MNDDRTYYPLRYRLDHADGFLIWFSDDASGIVTGLDGNIASFHDQQALLQYAASLHIAIKPADATCYDFDKIAQFVSMPLTSSFDCTTILDAWNMFGDVAASVGGEFDHDRQKTHSVYDKLFWGSNLPALTPPGERYVPEWNDAELILISETLKQGLELFRDSVRFSG